MINATTAREALSDHGLTRSQPASDWVGALPLPFCVEQFYGDVGPVDLWIESHGNPYFFPRLAALWDCQAGYRWNGSNGNLIEDWDDDWLVVGDYGGDPFLVARSSGVVLYGRHGEGVWEMKDIFPDLNTMATCLGRLGSIVKSAGHEIVDGDCSMRPEYRAQAITELSLLLAPGWDARRVLTSLDWS